MEEETRKRCARDGCDGNGAFECGQCHREFCGDHVKYVNHWIWCYDCLYGKSENIDVR